MEIERIKEKNSLHTFKDSIIRELIVGNNKPTKNQHCY